MSIQDNQNLSKCQNLSKNASDWPSDSKAFSGLVSSPEKAFFSPQNDPYFLIHGNNSSTTHKQGLDSPFDDFNPDYSDRSFFDRLSRYADAHSRAVDMANFIRAKFPVSDQKHEKKLGEVERFIATELTECGSMLVFHHFHTVNQIKLASMCSCKRHLLCPLCAIRRAAKAVKVYLEKYNHLVQVNPHLKPYLVTFTVKDGSDLDERFDHLQKSLRKYHDHRRKAMTSKKHKHNQANKALGGVGSYEIKIGKNSGVWHPHSHFIWLCDSVPDAVEISKEWLLITGDSHIVDVTPFHDDKNVSDGFLEVFKYALKYSSMTFEHNWEAYTVLQTRRLVSSFGIFYGLQIPEQMTDEIDFDELPYIELVYKYFLGSYKLVLSTNPQGNERSE